MPGFTYESRPSNASSTTAIANTVGIMTPLITRPAHVAHDNLSTRVGAKGVLAKGVTDDTRGSPNSVFVAWKSSDPPLLSAVVVRDGVGGGLVSGTAATEKALAKRGAWRGDITVVWARNALLARRMWWRVGRDACDGGNEEGNNEGSEAGHFDFWML